MPKRKVSDSLSVASFLALALFFAPPGYAAPDRVDPASDLSAPTVIFPKSSLGPDDLGVVVNDADPLSVEIAQYYKARRGIPEGNMIHVSFAPGSSVMSQAEFVRIKALVDAKTPQQVQAFALT